jgi:hypothetical protein
MSDSSRLACVLAVALVAFAGAGFVYHIGATNDLSRQRVNVRWAKDVDAQARRSLEKTLGLRDAERREGQT